MRASIPLELSSRAVSKAVISELSCFSEEKYVTADWEVGAPFADLERLILLPLTDFLCPDSSDTTVRPTKAFSNCTESERNCSAALASRVSEDLELFSIYARCEENFTASCFHSASRLKNSSDIPQK